MEQHDEVHCHRIASVVWEDDPNRNILIAVPFTMREFSGEQITKALDAAVFMANLTEEATIADLEKCLKPINCWIIQPLETKERML